jgi:hypothetical protein
MKKFVVFILILAFFSQLSAQEAVVAPADTILTKIDSLQRVIAAQNDRLKARYGVTTCDVRGAKRATKVKQMDLMIRKLEQAPVVADSVQGYACLLVNTQPNRTYEITIYGPDPQKKIIEPRSIEMFYLVPGKYIVFSKSKAGQSGAWFSDHYDQGDNEMFVSNIIKTVNLKTASNLSGYKYLDRSIFDGSIIKCHGYIMF